MDEIEKNPRDGMDNSTECEFDAAVRALVDRYSQDGLLTAGEIVAVLQFICHAVIHKAEEEMD
jgi:hypothetical protein